MKHNLSVTLMIIGLFLACHLIGLFLVGISNPVTQIINENNETVTIHGTTEVAGIGTIEPIDHPYIPILIGVLIGTGIMLLLIKFKKFLIMRSWHVIGITLCLYVSFYTLLNYFFSAVLSDAIIIAISLAISILFSIFRTYKPNVYTHNFTELFIYGGIAVLFASLFKTPDLKGASILYVSILLIGISIYDAIAVWQSKHMITLAKSQTEQKVFAGLFIPYKRKDEGTKEPIIQEQKIIYGNKSSLKSIPKKEVAKKSKSKQEKSDKSKVQTVAVHEEVTSAILGGGDIAFTLIFSAVVLLSTYSFPKAIIVSVITAASLAGLLIFAKKDKFYPAMPFLSAGCFIGYGLILLLP